MQQPQPREAFQNPDAYSSTTLRVVFCRAYDSERGASCGPRSSCGPNWRREFRSLVPVLGQLARNADNAPLFNYHSDNKYWDSLRGS